MKSNTIFICLLVCVVGHVTAPKRVMQGDVGGKACEENNGECQRKDLHGNCILKADDDMCPPEQCCKAKKHEAVIGDTKESKMKKNEGKPTNRNGKETKVKKRSERAIEGAKIFCSNADCNLIGGICKTNAEVKTITCTNSKIFVNDLCLTCHCCVIGCPSSSKCTVIKGKCSKICSLGQRPFSSLCTSSECKCCVPPCKMTSACLSQGGHCISQGESCSGTLKDQCEGYGCQCCIPGTPAPVTNTTDPIPHPHPCETVPGDFDTWYDSAIEKDVVVIGGGAAGLSAMKEFQKKGKNLVDHVVLLEAQNYVGGRVKTVRTPLGDTGRTVLTEDGAEWVQGGKKIHLYKLAYNKLHALAKRNDSWDDFYKRNNGEDANEKGQIVYKKLPKKCDFPKFLKPYYENTNDKGFGQCFIDRFDKSYQKSGAPYEEKEGWYFFLERMVNKDTGIDNWLDISARDAEHFLGDDEWNQWKDGYETLIHYLKKSIPPTKIKTSSPVCRIYWNEHDLKNQVLVVTKSGDSYLAKHVLITASVAYIQKMHSKLFIPQLPYKYRMTLSGMKLGVADKIQLGWATSWWGDQQLNLHIIWIERNLPKEKEWLYGIMEVVSIHQEHGLIQSFISGTYAKLMEDLPEDQVKDDLLEHLRSVMKVDVPEPLFFRRTTWGKHEFTFGSYNSYVTTEGNDAGIHSRKPLAKPIKNSYKKKVLLWAGEHTSTNRYGTVDGAMTMGKMTAKKIRKLLK